LRYVTDKNAFTSSKILLRLSGEGASPLPRPHPLTSAVTDTTDRYGPVITVGGVGCVGGDFSHTALRYPKNSQIHFLNVLWGCPGLLGLGLGLGLVVLVGSCSVAIC